MTTQPTVGQFAVFNDGFSEPRYVALQIVKVTAQKVMLREGAYRDRHVYKDNILFVGCQQSVEHLVERLTSSLGLMKDECRRSRERHTARVAKILRGDI